MLSLLGTTPLHAVPAMPQDRGTVKCDWRNEGAGCGGKVFWIEMRVRVAQYALGALS